MFIPDLLWLLLPVAAGAGWFAAKRNTSRSSDALWDYTRQFHRGLNTLLTDHNDQDTALFKALEDAGHAANPSGAGVENTVDSAHARSVRQDTAQESAETHIALGNLFRRRGEMERAILLHESVANKSELAGDTRAAARFELACDYDSAGLTDRSEGIFKELIASELRLDEAYEALLQLHEREHDWKQAIEVAVDYSAQCKSDKSSVIAHYFCELAQRAITEGENALAESLLADALQHSKLCARALIMLAEIALAAQDYNKALGLYEQVEAIRPELMPEIIDQQLTALSQFGDAQRLKDFVIRISAQRNAYSVVRSTREVIAKLHSPQMADRFFKDQILKRPSLRGLRDWAHDQLPLSKPGERDKVQVICDLLDQVMEDKPAYRCHSCGFQGNVMHWRCPSCGHWDSVSTIIGVEGE